MPPYIISLIAGGCMIIGLLGGAVLGVSKVKLPPKPQPHKSFSDHLGEQAAPQTFEDYTKIAAELDSWRRDLTEKNNKALLLDAELARREQVIQAERDALDKERARLDNVQKDMEGRLIKIRDNETTRLGELSTLYSTMKPDDAVVLMRALPPEQVTKVLTVMKEKIRAKLLNTWIEKYPTDRDVVAQITNDLVRTMNDSSDGGAPATASSATP